MDELNKNYLRLLDAQLYYHGQKYFYSIKRFDLMKQLKSLYRYFVAKDKTKGRLEPQGNTNHIMFIGVNPSIHSSLKNVWDDSYGKYFGEMLFEADIDQYDVWMTNLYKKPTEGNRALTHEEIDSGWKELEEEISMVSPKVIVALGSQVHSVFRDFYNSIPVIKLAHPSYIQRFANSVQRSNFINQLKKINYYVQK